MAESIPAQVRRGELPVTKFDRTWFIWHTWEGRDMLAMPYGTTWRITKGKS